MNQLTVRNVDDSLHAALKSEARRHGMSVNRYVVQILTEVVGLGRNQKLSQEYRDLDHLAGTWTREQFDEFNSFLDEQRPIDEELWA